MLRKVPCAFRVCVERSSGFSLLSVDSGDLSWGVTGYDISNWGLGCPYTPPGGRGQSVISADGDMSPDTWKLSDFRLHTTALGFIVKGRTDLWLVPRFFCFSSG